MTRVLAVIPARGGSKGLAGKNIRPFAGLPLIAHSILYAKLCPEITRSVVSTDSPDIARVAREQGGDVPFLRPADLARDDSSLWQVLRHALSAVEKAEGKPYDVLMLLDPTSPLREPADAAGALRLLAESSDATGVVSVSRPDFNPLSHAVVEKNGWMADLIEGSSRFERRQEVSTAVYHINGTLYVWRADFVRREESNNWRMNGKYRIYETPESRTASFDTLDQFERAEILVRGGLVRLPWMKSAETR